MVTINGTEKQHFYQANLFLSSALVLTDGLGVSEFDSTLEASAFGVPMLKMRKGPYHVIWRVVEIDNPYSRRVSHVFVLHSDVFEIGSLQKQQAIEKEEKGKTDVKKKKSKNNNTHFFKRCLAALPWTIEQGKSLDIDSGVGLFLSYKSWPQSPDEAEQIWDASIHVCENPRELGGTFSTLASKSSSLKSTSLKSSSLSTTQGSDLAFASETGFGDGSYPVYSLWAFKKNNFVDTFQNLKLERIAVCVQYI